MRLLDVYQSDSCGHLYRLLAERSPEQSISHKEMPSWEKHVEFVESRPYLCWYMVEVVTECVDFALVTEIAGAVYLSHNREIGIGIFKQYRGNGYGKSAVKMLMAKHPGRFLANVAPCNAPSIGMFRDLGFGHIQNTYALEAA